MNIQVFLCARKHHNLNKAHEQNTKVHLNI